MKVTRKALFAAIMMSIICSCVKEDRSKCPCYLHVDLSRIDINNISKVDIVTSSSSGEARWTAVPQSAIGDTLILQVDKDEIDFCAWGNLKGSAILDNSRTIETKERPDSLWSDYRRLATRCEDMYVTVEPVRQHIPLTIIVRGMLLGISEVQPVVTRVSHGFDFNGRATSKTGSIIPTGVASPAQNDGYYQFNALMMTQPNATDAILELYFKIDGESRMVSYPLGEQLYRSGENISLTNQKPVIVDLVMGGGSIFLTLTVSDWISHDTIEITF